jgi:hypothetical protein
MVNRRTGKLLHKSETNWPAFQIKPVQKVAQTLYVPLRYIISLISWVLLLPEDFDKVPNIRT